MEVFLKFKNSQVQAPNPDPQTPISEINAQSLQRSGPDRSFTLISHDSTTGAL